MSKDAGQKALQHFLNSLARVTARSRSMVARCISVLFSVTIISPRNRCLPPFGFLLCAARRRSERYRVKALDLQRVIWVAVGGHEGERFSSSSC